MNSFRKIHTAFRAAEQRGFTLIELLIVVAIIAILAAIALPNFLEAQTRSKIARCKSDMRTLSVGLETYAVDNNCYPPLPIALPQRFRRFRPLTTPISYLSSIPVDPFRSKTDGPGRFGAGMYEYGATPIDHPSVWALASDGPDRHDDTPMLGFYTGYEEGLFLGQVEDYEGFMIYDPTNGTISRGDLVRCSDYIQPG